MSIQAAREAISKNAGALKAADATFFASVEKRYTAIKASGSGHPADLRRLQSDVAAWATNLIGNKDWSNDRDTPAYDGAMAWSDLIGTEIDLMVIAGPSARGAAPRSGWVDVKTGEAVKVYSSSEKIAEANNYSGPGVGDILNGLLAGPRTPEIKAALETGTQTAGGYTVPDIVLGEFFDKLRAQSQFINAGARTILLDGRTTIARIDSDPVPAWRDENEAVTESEPTFGAVNFTPRSLACLVKMSEELLADSVNAAEALETALLGALSVELDRACLFGSGASSQPLGLYNQVGINSVSMGTDGAVPANWDEILDAVYDIELANGGPATAAIHHPRTARTYRKLKDTTNQPLMMPESLRDVRFLPTTSVPINQTQGTGTALSTIIVGNYPKAILGLRQSLVIRRLTETFAGNLQVGFLAYLRADVGVEQPKAFTRITGVKV
tara:strand:- start:11884 stop:13206 length:1323 start_codon:yes stop_codon:yes gene_type:complete